MCLFSFFYYYFPINMQNIGCIGVQIEGNQMNWFSVKNHKQSTWGFDFCFGGSVIVVIYSESGFLSLSLCSLAYFANEFLVLWFLSVMLSLASRVLNFAVCKSHF